VTGDNRKWSPVSGTCCVHACVHRDVINIVIVPDSGVHNRAAYLPLTLLGESR
jgi:hypothetical protein